MHLLNIDFRKSLRTSYKILVSDRILLSLLGILVLATLLRFFDFQNRFALSYDPARDLIVARQGLAQMKFPLIGPFSSAGAFVYGPQWYVILMVLTLFPFLTVPFQWVVMGIFSLLVVFLMFLIGTELIDRRFGLLLSLLTAISTTHIGFSIALVSPTMAQIVVFIAVYFFIRSIKYNSYLDYFLFAFSLGNAINIHYSPLSLVIMFPVLFFFIKKRVSFIFLSIAGFLIPFIPLAIFDFQNNHFQIKNMLDYYLYGQYRIYYPNRWLTYLGIFWPTTWAGIVGGFRVASYPLIGLTVGMIVYTSFKRRMTKSILALSIVFIGVVYLLRSYRGELTDAYTLFTHPFVLILSGWALWMVFTLYPKVGKLLIALIVATTLSASVYRVYTEVRFGHNDYPLYQSEVAAIKQKYPNQAISLYDYKGKSERHSLSLSLLLDETVPVNDTGVKLGHYATNSAQLYNYPLVFDFDFIKFFDLSSKTDQELQDEGWANENPSHVYHSVEEWYKDKQL